MPEYRRAHIPGGSYFFTVCTRSRRPILTNAPIRQALMEALEHVRVKYPFHMDAWVILPDHLHCLWTLPEGDSAFSERWSMVKRIVTQRCKPLSVVGESQTRRHREGEIWQRRFWEHSIRSDNDYRIHLEYIHWNPVKHGYAPSALEWPFSSFCHFVARGIYDADWGTGERRFEGRIFGE